MQLQKALAMESELHKGLPGYINSIGMPDGPKSRASWVVTTFPYLEQQELWEKWSAGKPEFKAIDILGCPSDPPINENDPQLSYVANAGYIGNAAGEENKANGLFFDRARVADGAPEPSDERDVTNQPRIRWNLKKVVESDGRTMMLTENTYALYWGYRSFEDEYHTKDRSYHFGFCWEQPAVVDQGIKDQTAEGFRRINGNLARDEPTIFAELTIDHGFPSSYHPGGVNVAFADGAVTFITDDIDPMVYAQLMTSDRDNSDLINAAGVPEKELPQPEEGKGY
jgi:prepilin-type processing-associated H-X9-DG protein